MPIEPNHKAQLCVYSPNVTLYVSQLWDVGVTEESPIVIARVARQDGEGELQFEVSEKSNVTKINIDLNGSVETHSHPTIVENKHEVVNIVKRNDFGYSFVSENGEVEVEYNEEFFME